MSRRRARQGGTWKERLGALKNLPPTFSLIWHSGSRYVTAGLLLRLVVAVSPVLALWVTKQIIDAISYAVSHPGPISTHVVGLLLMEFGIAAMTAVGNRAVDYCDGRIAEQFSREVNLRVMRYAGALDLQSMEDPDFCDRLERARVQGTDRIGMLKELGRLIQQAVTLISLSAGVLWFSPPLFALLIFAVVPAFLGESHFAFLEYALAYSLTPLRRELDYLRDLGTKKEGAKELRVFGLANHLAGRFTEINDQVIYRSSRLALRRLRTGAVLAVIGSIGYYGAYAFLVYRALQGSITIGLLTFLAGSLAACSSQIQLVFSSFTSIADQAMFLTDLFTFFETKPVIRNSANALLVPRPIRQGFEFRDVSFCYPGNDRLVLDKINLRIAPGERIALVGANGQGKTTLVKLLSRLYEPTSGKILLDGVDLADYDIHDLRKRIGVVFQDFMRYDFTARENIAVGRIEMADDDRRILETAHASGAHSVLQRFPDGLDQMLGRRFQDGVDLSGGEWQKIAIARAYLRDADILILDEPTAALDAISEHEVFSRFTELTDGRMAILISHRLSTVTMSDRIIVLSDGQIQEEGTHQELMADRRRYARMFELQASRYLSPTLGPALAVDRVAS